MGKNILLYARCFGCLAQLIRASRLHREGRGFESLNIHHKISLTNAVSLRNFSATRSLVRSVAFFIAQRAILFCAWGCGTKTPEVRGLTMTRRDKRQA